jgi:hypothetical protein
MSVTVRCTNCITLEAECAAVSLLQMNLQDAQVRNEKLELALRAIQRRSERHRGGSDQSGKPDNLDLDQMLTDLIWIAGRVTEVLANRP